MPDPEQHMDVRDTETVPEATLRNLTQRIFESAGCDPETAQLTTDMLIEAELRGHSTHGMLRVPAMVQRIESGRIDPGAQPKVVTEREATALVDAQRALGAVGVTYGAKLAVQKAKHAGSCTVGVINADHIGLAGYYAEQIARAGCVGILCGVTMPLVHPLGGLDRLLGTNPLAIAVPTGGDNPILLDFATSAIAMGTVLEAQITGDPIPEGGGIGPHGQPTTNADEIRQGALSPFGGHKGYGLCLMIGLIAGPMLGAKVGKPLGEAVRTGYYDKGELIIAIDPEAFGGPAIFRAAVDAHIAELRDVTPIPGALPVRVPGERSFAERKRRLRDGIPVDPQVWSELVLLAGP